MGADPVYPEESTITAEVRCLRLFHVLPTEQLSRVICYGEDITGRFVSEFCGVELQPSERQKRMGGRESGWSQATMSTEGCALLEKVYPDDFKNWRRCENI